MPSAVFQAVVSQIIDAHAEMYAQAVAPNLTARELAIMIAGFKDGMRTVLRNLLEIEITPVIGPDPRD